MLSCSTLKHKNMNYTKIYGALKLNREIEMLKRYQNSIKISLLLRIHVIKIGIRGALSAILAKVNQSFQNYKIK